MQLLAPVRRRLLRFNEFMSVHSLLKTDALYLTTTILDLWGWISVWIEEVAELILQHNFALSQSQLRSTGR